MGCISDALPVATSTGRVAKLVAIISDLPPLGRTAINDVVSPYNLHVLNSTSLSPSPLHFL
jgi:hypothetical protein